MQATRQQSEGCVTHRCISGFASFRKASFRKKIQDSKLKEQAGRMAGCLKYVRQIRQKNSFEMGVSIGENFSTQKISRADYFR
jgi:hypothetical protein